MNIKKITLDEAFTYIEKNIGTRRRSDPLWVAAIYAFNNARKDPKQIREFRKAFKRAVENGRVAV